MNIRKQIELGLLVCPKTKQRLSISHDNQWLENVDKTEHYSLLNGAIPILLIDAKWAEKYANDSKVMTMTDTQDLAAGDYVTLAVMDWGGTGEGKVYGYDVAIERKGRYGLTS